jgi:Protein of unknown function (DUF2671)
MNERIKNQESEDILTDIKYICKTSGLITESLQKGCDVAQLPNGDIIVSEVKTVNTQYSWDSEKNRMIRIR